MEYNAYEHDTYNLYTVKTDKFNSTRIEVIFKLKCTKENITFAALLFDVLMDSNSKYKTKKELARALEDLYDADMYSSVTRVGGMLIISAVIDVLNYTEIENTIKRAIDMLFTTIFSPNLINGTFPNKTLQKVKREISDNIKSISEDTKQESILNALKYIKEDDIRALSISGDLEVLDSISQENLYDFYKKLMNEADKEIYVLGDIDPNSIDDYIFKENKFNSITDKKIDIYLDDIKVKKINKKCVSDDTQANYVEIYALNYLSSYERDYVVTLFNAIWGSGSLESRLYKELRGKRGLCYNVNAYYQKYDKCLIVHVATDKKNVDKIPAIISSTISDIIKEGVSDNELSSCKKLILNSLDLIKDSPTKIIDNYVFRNMNQLSDIDERKRIFNNITAKELKLIAKKLKLVISYTVGGNK